MAEIYETAAETTAPSTPLLALRWLVVGLPLAWGIFETIKKSLALFGG